LAYHYAKENILNQISHTSQIPGKDWIYLFREHYGDLFSHRKPTRTTFARSRGFSREDVSRFFKILEEKFEKKMYQAAKVFNVDERGL
jgi:hypothetical protein